MRAAIVLSLTALAALSSLASPQDGTTPAGSGPPGFEARLDAARRAYAELAVDVADRLLRGDLAGATHALRETVPAAERDGAQALVAGDLLLPLDPDAARALHEEAFAKDSKGPAVIEAWALEQHRAGRFAEAEALYVELLALGLGDETDARLHALRADCLLHLDRPEEACAAWRALDAPMFHGQVEQAAARVYAPASPEARRCALLQRALGTDDDTGALDDLLLLDLHWDPDSEDVEVNAAYTAHDLALAQRILGADSLHFRILAFLARWTSPGRRFDFDGEIPKLQPPADNREAIATDAEALRLTGAQSEPPVNGGLASRVFQILLENEVVTAEELLEQHEAELRRRARSSQGDVEALRVLLGLYEQTWNDELDELQRLGWTRYGELECALSLLSSQRDGLRPNDPMLVQALAANPGDVRLCRLALEAAEREGELLVEPVSRLTRAEFAHMEECQRVSQLFRRLEAALRDRK